MDTVLLQYHHYTLHPSLHIITTHDTPLHIGTQLLLGLLPRERAQWEAAAVSKRKQYEQYCQELILDPSSFRGGAVALLGEAYRQKEVWFVCHTPIPHQTHTHHTHTNTLQLATRQDAEDLSLAAAAVREEDHPLSQAQGSKWAMYFKVCGLF